MVNKRVEFYYDYGSPTAYLAWTQLPAICAKHGAELLSRPVLLGGIFKAVESTTPVAIKPKGAWMFDDIARFAKRYGVPFAMNPHFIVNTLGVMRGAIWAADCQGNESTVPGYPPMGELIALVQEDGGTVLGCSSCIDQYCPAPVGDDGHKVLRAGIERVGLGTVTIRMADVHTQTVNF